MIQQAGSGVNVVKETNSLYIELPNNCVIQCGVTSYSNKTEGSITTVVSNPVFATVMSQKAHGGDDADYGIACYASSRNLKWYCGGNGVVKDYGSNIYWCVIGFK